MKRSIIIIVSIIISITPLFSNLNRNYSKLLAKYVNTKGFVNYKTMFKDPLFMNTYHEFKFSLINPGKGNKRIALLINAYNYFVMYHIKKFYPISTVTSIKNFFTKNFIPYMGRNISLNTLEKKILFKYFPDPRLHFALVCGAKSCPPLINRVYSSSTLYWQLLNSTFNFMRTTQGFKLKGNTIYLSKLFNWYKRDFGGTDSSLKKFVAKLRPRLKHKIMKNKIKYLPYNWALNGH